MGYEGVEFAGLYDHSPETVRDMVKDSGLVPISAHVPYPELKEDLENTLDAYVTLGCPYIAIPYLPGEFHPAEGRFDEAVTWIRSVGEACKHKGITLLYHNHDFEFQKMPDGRFGLDYLYESIEPELLQTEIDVCWVKVSGIDPAGYIRKYTGRAPLVHLKDYVGQKSDGMYGLLGVDEAKEQQAFAFRAVGHGCQDIPAILRAEKEAGSDWKVVEQDSHPVNPAMEDARLSINYLKLLEV